MSRPKLVKKKISKSITLNDDILRYATKVGNGNLSLGVEIAVRFLKDARKLKKEKEESTLNDEADS